jgi:hypothetical protein
MATPATLNDPVVSSLRLLLPGHLGSMTHVWPFFGQSPQPIRQHSATLVLLLSGHYSRPLWLHFLILLCHPELAATGSTSMFLLAEVEMWVKLVATLLGHPGSTTHLWHGRPPAALHGNSGSTPRPLSGHTSWPLWRHFLILVWSLRGHSMIGSFIDPPFLVDGHLAEVKMRGRVEASLHAQRPPRLHSMPLAWPLSSPSSSSASPARTRRWQPLGLHQRSSWL